MKSPFKMISSELGKALSKKEVWTKALFERPECLPNLLPYEEYLPEHKVFVMKDGSLGAVFEAKLLEHETMTEQEIVDQVSSLKSWFAQPDNCVLQVLYEQSELTSRDRVFDELTSSFTDAQILSKRLFDEKLNAFRNASGKSTELSPMRRRCFISVRYFTDSTKPASLVGLQDKDHNELASEVKSFVRHIRRFVSLTGDLQANSQLKLTRVGGSELIEFLRRFFNPKTFYNRPFAKFNENSSLSSQYLFNSPVLDCAGIEREGIKTRTLPLKTSPLIAYPGGMAYFSKLSFPFLLSINISFPSKEKVKRYFDLKEFFLQNTPSARAKIQREEILNVQDKLARDDRCVNMTFSVIIEAENDELLDDRTRQVCNVFNNDLECEVIKENDIGLGLCLNSLPLCYSPEADLSSQRAIRILRSDAINFIPIFDSFRGTKTPVSLFLSRENNIVPFSLLDNETSNHTIVVADTGSGKSSFVADWIHSAKRMSPEPLCFIIDKKCSYTMLAEYFDGDVSVFDRTKEVPFNPFRGHYDEEKIAFLCKLLLTSIQLTSPSFLVESEHQASVSKAIKLAFIKKSKQLGLNYVEGEFRKSGTQKQCELSMEDVVTELGALEEFPRETIEALVMKLRPFYHDGTYAKFFRSTSETKSSNRFYVYDLDSLDSDPVLQTLMTMSVFEEIRRIMALPENFGRQSFIIFEEFARQGKNNSLFADFAIDFAETMRKKGGWIVALTPRPQNYFETDIGRAFWGVADNFVFLAMNSDSVDYVSKNSSILDEASKEIVRSLRTVRGKYAEVFYTNKKKSCSGAFRSWLFPTSRWMTPTNAIDTKEVLHALETHTDKWKALEFLIANAK